MKNRHCNDRCSKVQTAFGYKIVIGSEDVHSGYSVRQLNQRKLVLKPFHLAEAVRNHKIDGEDLAVGLGMMGENMTAVLTGTDESV